MMAVLAYFTQTPLLELTAVLFSVLYVLLAAKVNIWCWPAAFISTAIYSYIFYDVTLFMDSMLNIYYLMMALYGWYCWRTSTNMAHQQTVKLIQKWPLQRHVICALLILCLVGGLGWLMANYTRASFPYLDTLTTLFAVFATYLVTQKVLENWLYWIVIDLVSIYLYLAKDLQPTAMLFSFYVIISGFGYWHWRKCWLAQRQGAIKQAVPSYLSVNDM
jgi:nicotinamide mononucleotide transporter